jgi:hypothetical protein
MKQALVQRMNNISVVSVGSVPIIRETFEETENINQ